MPSYIITCKEDATPEQVEATKQHARDEGGKVVHEYKIIKGFSVEYPEGSVHSLSNHQHVKAIEDDKPMSTQ